MKKSTLPHSHPEVDDTDLQILEILQQQAKRAYAEVGEQISVSGGTVHVRMKKLERLGIVQAARLQIDYRALGFDVQGFLGITLSKSVLYDEVTTALEEIPEILTLHSTTGHFHLMARIVCRNSQHLRELIHEKIQKTEGIQNVEVFMELEERFARPPRLTNR